MDLENKGMSEKFQLGIVAAIAVLAISGLIYVQAQTPAGAQVIGEGGTVPGLRHSCGGNIIGYDVPSYYIEGGYYYYECFLCPGNSMNPQPHAMCEYWPLPSAPVGAPRGISGY